MTAADAHLDAGAMALDCLPPDEAAEFLAHVDTCATCAVEMIGFRETAALLGAAVAAPAPASLRRSVLAGIAVTVQLPPLVNAPAAPAETSPPALVLPLRRPWYRRPQALIAAAAAALVLVGGIAIALSRTASAPSTATSCTQTASDVQTFSPAVGAGGSVVYAASCRTARVSAAGLAALPADKVYQLWVLDAKGQPRSVGVMKTSPNGSVDAMDAPVQSGDTATAISVENAPGPAAAPSKDIVWVTKL